jgi:hypothetical protein
MLSLHLKSYRQGQKRMHDCLLENQGHRSGKSQRPRWKVFITENKTINKTYIRKNKTNIYINTDYICTNNSFIYTFQRSSEK